MPRSFIFGDIHGDLAALERALSLLPPLDAGDTLIFLGDYLDRGPHSAQVVERVMRLHEHTAARVVALRGNHEDAWLRVLDEGWDNYVATAKNGTLATLRSFAGQPVPEPGETPTNGELAAMSNASFLPGHVIAWLRCLPYWYENEHGIFVHGALPARADGSFPHPSEVEPESTLAWCSDPSFFRTYTGKRVVVGHTSTRHLPQSLSEHTPGDPSDMFQHGSVFGLDTGAGSGGFLTALELPSTRVYESRLLRPKGQRAAAGAVGPPQRVGPEQP
ncbi:MAG TPA: metallophosphoesterase family protein [Polyangiaceae bacterium]|nr:metallophosphoesterase family protein [Polyangiaceae bacterium]